jgi:hypothetical protein
LVKQPVLAYGPDRLAKLDESFKANQFNMKKLAAEIVAETAITAETRRHGVEKEK